MSMPAVGLPHAARPAGPAGPAGPATSASQPRAQQPARTSATVFEEWAARAPSILSAARTLAQQDGQFDARVLRARIVAGFQQAFAGKRPHEWQINVSEALALGVSSIVIAPTGAGKTMPFMMPLLADNSSQRTVIVLSPLNELEEDQARRFRAAGLTATPVNRDVYTETLKKKILAGKYRAIITSPEMCLKHPSFAAVVRTPAFMKNVLAIIVDEAHCITQWKDTFRRSFGELIRLRSAAGLSTPLLVTSATLTPGMLDDISRDLELARATTYFVNLGNNRANLVPIVHRMRGSASSLPILSFLVPKNATTADDLERAIVFFNSRDLAHTGAELLRRKVRAHLQDKISFLHAGRSAHARKIIMQQFRAGEIRILCATEAAGMGLDIADIPLTIQYMAAPSAAVYTQRSGRAGRDGQLAIAILLVEAAAFQVKKSAKAEVKEPAASRKKSILPPPCGVEYKKSIEPAMREYISTTACRRDIMDRYYCNPPRAVVEGQVFPCCDNCIKKKEANGGARTAAERRIDKILEQMAQLDNGREDEEEEAEIEEKEDAPGEDDVKPSISGGRIGDRKAEHLAECRRSLEKWRRELYSREYAACVFKEETLLPAKILTVLARQRRLKTAEDVESALPQWVLGQRYATEVLGILAEIDGRYDAERERVQQENRELRARRSQQNKLERNETRNATRRAERALKKEREASAKASASLASMHPLTTMPYQGTTIPMAYAGVWRPV